MLTASISQLVRGYFTGSKNTQSGSYHKVSFPEPVAHYRKKGLMEMPALFVIFSVSLLLHGMSLHSTFGIVLKNPETLA